MIRPQRRIAPPAITDLTRRRLLGSGAAAAAGLLAEAPLARALAARASRPELLPVSADVWSSRLEVTGGPAGALLSDNGVAVATTPTRHGFTGVLPLCPGANLAAAENGVGRSAEKTYVARRRAAPTARITLAVAQGTVQLDASASETDPYSGAPLTRFDWVGPDGEELGSAQQIRLQGPFAEGDHYVRLTVTDQAGVSDSAAALVHIQSASPQAPDGAYQPEWVRRAIVYGVIPPLFGSPPLDAVTASLKRLAGLGVNVLWLAPIFATVPGDFGYAVTDHFAVRPEYGDLEALQGLVEQAHARGMRVMLDMPLNDTSSHHPYFMQAKRFKAAQSHYWPFYERGPHGEPTYYFSWRHLPNLSYESAEVRRLALEAAGYWLREANVDGFRCDAAWGVAARAPGFWSEWTAEVRRIRPDALLLAESSAQNSGPEEEGFDAAYDWGAELGEWAWGDAFSRSGVSVPALAQAIGRQQGTRPFRFLDNNDTGTRFITVQGAGMTRAALALLLALPGIPCIYTGEEIGAEYLPYEQTRPLKWDKDPDQLEGLIAQLCAERLERPALQHGQLQTLQVNPAEAVMAFETVLPSERLLVAINLSDEPTIAEIPSTGTSIPLGAWSAEIRVL